MHVGSCLVLEAASPFTAMAALVLRLVDQKVLSSGTARGEARQLVMEAVHHDEVRCNVGKRGDNGGGHSFEMGSEEGSKAFPKALGRERTLT